MAKVKSFGERIADALVEDGLLSAGQVEETRGVLEGLWVEQVGRLPRSRLVWDEKTSKCSIDL